MADFKTSSELKIEAFSILTGMDPNSVPSADELTIFDNYLDPLIAQLHADRVVTIYNKEEIPNEYFLPVARLLANVSGPRFGSPMNEDAKRVDETLLRRISSGETTYETLQANYF